MYLVKQVPKCLFWEKPYTTLVVTSKCRAIVFMSKTGWLRFSFQIQKYRPIPSFKCVYQVFLFPRYRQFAMNNFQVYVNLLLHVNLKAKITGSRTSIRRAELDNDHALRLVYISPSLASRPWLVKHTRQTNNRHPPS